MEEKVYKIRWMYADRIYDSAWTDNCAYLSIRTFKRSYADTHKRELNDIREDDILAMSTYALYKAFHPNGQIFHMAVHASCEEIKHGQRPPCSDEAVERRDKVFSTANKIRLITNTLERALGKIGDIDFQALEEFNTSVDVFYKEAERRLKVYEDPEIDAHDLSDLNEMLAIFASRYVSAKFDQDYTTWFSK